MANEENLKPQWEAGESGNPNGRPKGSKNVSTYLKKYLAYQPKANDPLFPGDPIFENMPLAERMAIKLMRHCLLPKKIDIHVYREIADRTEGKPIQFQQVDNKNPEQLIVEVFTSKEEKEKKMAENKNTA